MIPRLARNSHGSQTFWGVDETDSGGVIGVIIDGADRFNGDTLSSTWHYCGVVTATGISPGTHIYQMMLDGVAVGDTYSFNAIGNKGSDLEFMFIGDALDSNSSFQSIVDREHSIDACWSVEMSYIDGGEYGINWANLIASNNPNDASTGYGDTDTAVYRNAMSDKHRGSIIDRRNLARKSFYAKYAQRMLPGNHEIQSLTPGPNSRPGQNLYNGARDAFYSYYTMGNPGSFGVVDTVPAEGVLYYSEILGNTEIVHCDIVTYHDDAIDIRLNGAVDGRGEDRQKQWLIDIISNTTAKFLLIYLGTAVTPISEWIDSSTGIFRAIADSQVSIVIIGANNHAVYARQHTLFGSNVMEIGVSPLRQVSVSAPITVSGQLMYFDDSIASTFDDPFAAGVGPGKTRWVYGKIIERPNGSPRNSVPHIECEIINALTGYKRFSFTVDENRNIGIQRNLSVI